MSTTEKMSDYFGTMRNVALGACWTREFNGGRWHVTRGTTRVWHLLFEKDGIWHPFGTFPTRKAAVAAYDAMEV